MPWLKRSMENQCGVTKYIRVEPEKIVVLIPEFLPHKMLTGCLV